MKRVLGISVHTGWGACVVVGGSPKQPEILANAIVEVLGDAERFCFHLAEKMPLAEAVAWIASARKKALANARRVLAPLVGAVEACAIVAKPGDAPALEPALASHPRLHTAEGCFYRDTFAAACGALEVRLVPPAELDPSSIGKLAPPPWGRDQKLAALAAWKVMGK